MKRRTQERRQTRQRQLGLGKLQGTTRRWRSAAARLSFESLEQRAMLAADPGWAFALGGSSYLTDSVVEVGPDNFVYVAGGFEGTVDFDPGPGTVQRAAPIGAQDGFIAKYSPQGQLVWVNEVAGAGLEECRGLDFDAAGNLYLVGNSNSATTTFDSTTLVSHGDFDTFVTKVNPTTGAFEWAQSAGGPLLEASQMIEVSDAGEVYLIGYFHDTADFDPSAADVFNLTTNDPATSNAYILKLDATGDFAWARQFSSSFDVTGHCVSVDNNGSIYAVGTFRDTADFGEPGNPLLLTAPKSVDADVYIVKLDDATGNSLWARQATGPEHINAGRVVTDAAGNIYVAGGFEGTMDFGPGTPTLVSSGGADVFISKWDAAGNIVWAEALATGADDAFPAELKLDNAANLLVGVGFQGTADFNPGPQQSNLTSYDASNDGALVALNSDGSFGWVRQASGMGVTEIRGIDSDSAGNVYICGLFQSVVSLPTGHALTGGGRGTFFAKIAFGDAPTKFYVVDDATTNRVFEYEAAGANGSNSALNSGNSAPRGAASTTAGDRVWVVDANRRVYVYDINANLLGSWSAGSMAGNATPEGIATNGTDVWIVDSKSDKVFKYTGAASRLSGSQNAASSFNLNSGNTNPKDIVTNGSSLWVVNDAATDKVFKYSVSGSLLGSWTIDSANSQPTGITIDPANVSDIWIVDNGTDRVYQYTGAASRTSGSQAAGATFALAAGNTNPQGIADPPAAVVASGGVQQDLSSVVWSADFRQDDSARGTARIHSNRRNVIDERTAIFDRDAVFDDFVPRPNYMPLSASPLEALRIDRAISSWGPAAELSGATATFALETALADF